MRWLVKFVPDEFVPHLPRYSAYGLTPSGSAQALFKTLRFVLKLELFRVYIGISPHDYRLIFRHITREA
ncbi:hypothetical protein Q7O_001885 [Pectobacterium carotovorum subsp. carotovorum PCCS1]|nr:hypothetical protein [Pectobacterium carotovorum subsp. carotovorum PCCS1]